MAKYEKPLMSGKKYGEQTSAPVGTAPTRSSSEPVSKSYLRAGSPLGLRLHDSLKRGKICDVDV